MKRKLILGILTLFISSNVVAQDWMYNIAEAKQKAASENKKIVLVFAGSDWCGPCIKLEKKIWESNDFQNLSKQSFVMLKADFPRRKKNKLSKEQEKHNDALAEIYNPSGNFPLVVVLDEKGNVLGKKGYENISPTAYFNDLKSLAQK